MSDATHANSRAKRHERALAAARRRLRLLEVETHRIKAELARLESEYEDELADELLIDGAGESGAPVAADKHKTAAADRPRTPLGDGPVIAPRPQRAAAPTPAAGHRSAGSGASPRRPAKGSIAPIVVGPGRPGSGHPDTSGKSKRTGRPAAGALLSLALHVGLLLLLLPFSFAVLSNENVLLMASNLDVDVPPVAEAEPAPVELVDDMPLESPQFSIDSSPLGLEEAQSSDLLLADDTSAADLAESFGQIDRLPADVGALMAGGGSGSGQGGARRGDASGGSERLGKAAFFGAQTRGNRFVFLVDSSRSMKGGRFEMALAELQRSIVAMTRRQWFYVIFVSDQPYAMFHPQPVPRLLPATDKNKQALASWLQRLKQTLEQQELALGKNRELITAMDLAASLQPDAVFFLWDGDLRYSKDVRRDVMHHFTRPQPWNFTIHTLGMGVESLDAQQYLAAIAAAHGGAYRNVPVPDTSDR